MKIIKKTSLILSTLLLFVTTTTSNDIKLNAKEEIKVTNVEDFKLALKKSKNKVIVVDSLSFDDEEIQINNDVIIRSANKDSFATFNNARFVVKNDNRKIKVDFKNIRFIGKNGEIDTNENIDIDSLVETTPAIISETNANTFLFGCSFNGFNSKYGAVQINTLQDTTNSSLYVEDCSFTSNVGQFGGAISCNGNDETKLVVKRSRFLNNYSSVGGAIFTKKAEVELFGDIFFKNSYSGEECEFKAYGGAVYADDCQINTFKCHYTENQFKNAGALALVDSNALVFDSIFNKNVASEDSGAIYSENSNFLLLNNSIFENKSDTHPSINVINTFETLNSALLFNSIAFNESINISKNNDFILNDDVEKFGSLFIDPTAVYQTPNLDNGYNYFSTENQAIQDGVIQKNGDNMEGHIFCKNKNDSFNVPGEFIGSIFEGKFANNIGTFFIGDNSNDSFGVTIENGRNEKQFFATEMDYSDIPYENGVFSEFNGWYLPNGSKFDENVLIGRDVSTVKIVAKYRVYNENTVKYLLLPISALLALITLLYFLILFIYHKRYKVLPLTGSISFEDKEDMVLESIDDSPIEQYSYTNKEYEVINLLLEGKKRNEISEILNISENTVKKRLASIYKKAKVSNRTEFTEKYGK